MAEPGTFRLEGINENIVIEGYMDGPPVVTAGYGGWNKTARPRRKALTEWIGRDPVSITWTFHFQAEAENEGRFIEQLCRDLESGAGLDSDDPEPPLFQLHSEPEALMPHGYHRASHVKWFIETLTWDKDRIAYNRVGNRWRAGGEITVTQYVEDKHLRALDPPKRSSSSDPCHKSRVKRYRVKRGDNLRKISAKYLGSSKCWRRIAKLNGIRDPNKLRVGQLLKMP